MGSPGYGGTTWDSSLGGGVEPAWEQNPKTGFMVEYNDQSCFTSLAQNKGSPTEKDAWSIWAFPK